MTLSKFGREYLRFVLHMDNLVRKQAKNVNHKLMEKTKQYDEIFNNVQNISFEFVSKIDQGKSGKFESFFNNYQSQIKDLGEKIPMLKREIREFGIY